MTLKSISEHGKSGPMRYGIAVEDAFWYWINKSLYNYRLIP